VHPEISLGTPSERKEKVWKIRDELKKRTGNGEWALGVTRGNRGVEKKRGKKDQGTRSQGGAKGELGSKWEGAARPGVRENLGGRNRSGEATKGVKRSKKTRHGLGGKKSRS